MRTRTAVLSVAALLTLAACGDTIAAQQAEPRTFMVYFQSGSAELTPEARAIVADIASAARHAERPEIVVEGAADRSQDADVGQRRIAAVEDALHASGVSDAMVTLRNGDASAGDGIAGRRVRVTLEARQR